MTINIEVLHFMKLLIVEDDTIQLAGLKHIIEYGYPDSVIYTASNYNDAVSVINSCSIDIFMLDINLGDDKTGLDICSYIRSTSGHEFTPVIFITDITNPSLDVINKYHCNYYFSKPYNRDDVISALKSVCDTDKSPDCKLQLKDIQGILFNVLPSDIVYTQSAGHHKHIFTTNGDFIVTGQAFDTLFECIDIPLVRCHKSYYFNPSFIHSYDRTNSVLRLNQAQEVIPVGRKYKSLVETYMENR